MNSSQSYFNREWIFELGTLLGRTGCSHVIVSSSVHACCCAFCVQVVQEARTAAVECNLFVAPSCLLFNR